MPSTRRKKLKREGQERWTLADYGNMSEMLGEGNSNSIETDLENGPEGLGDSGALLHH